MIGGLLFVKIKVRIEMTYARAGPYVFKIKK